MIIDAHCHVYGLRRTGVPREFARHIWDTLGLAENPRPFWRGGVVTEESLEEDPAVLIEDMDRVGIDKAVIFGMSIPKYGRETRGEEIAEVVAKWPDRLIGLHSAYVLGGTAAVKEMVRAIEDLGLKGVVLFPVYNGVDAGDRRLYPLYQRAEELGVPIFVHAGFTSGPDFKFAKAPPFPLDDVAQYFPDLKIMIKHGGSQWSLETLTLMRNHRNIYAGFAGWDDFPPTEHLARTLLWAKSLGLIDRLLWATDWPMTDQAADMARFRGMPRYMKEHGMEPAVTSEDITEILGRNAARLFGLLGPGGG